MEMIEDSLTDLQMKSVAELVHAAQAGDRNAFGELFERYRPAIVALATRRVCNADEAEELTQDVFVQAMQKLDQLRVCLLYTSPSPRDLSTSRMPSSA